MRSVWIATNRKKKEKSKMSKQPRTICYNCDGRDIRLSEGEWSCYACGEVFESDEGKFNLVDDLQKMRDGEITLHSPNETLARAMSRINTQKDSITSLTEKLSEANRLADLYLRIDMDHQKQLTSARKDAAGLREACSFAYLDWAQGTPARTGHHWFYQTGQRVRKVKVCSHLGDPDSWYTNEDGGASFVGDLYTNGWWAFAGEEIIPEPPCQALAASEKKNRMSDRKKLIEALGILPECECFEDEVTGGHICDGCVIRVELDRLTAELDLSKDHYSDITMAAAEVNLDLIAARAVSARLREALVNIEIVCKPHACQSTCPAHSVAVSVETIATKALSASEIEIEIPIQVLGKVISKLHVSPDTDSKTLEALALSNSSIQEFIEGKTVRKVVVIPGRLINIVTN